MKSKYSYRGFPSGSDGKESACSAGDLRSVPGSGKSLEKATHSSILAGEFHGQRSLESYSPWGCKELDMFVYCIINLVDLKLTVFITFLQIASHSGYVQIDWKRVEKDVNKAKRQIKKRANKAAPEINNIIEEATEFVKQNIVICSGFVGGFLLGLAS